MRILLVEDDEDLKKLFAKVLRRVATVVVHSSARDAIVHLEHERVHVVIADVGLGSGDSGLWLLSEVRRRWPDVHRIATSGAVYETDELLLLKPFTLAELTAALPPQDEGRTSSTPPTAEA